MGIWHGVLSTEKKRVKGYMVSELDWATAETYCGNDQYSYDCKDGANSCECECCDWCFCDESTASCCHLVEGMEDVCRNNNIGGIGRRLEGVFGQRQLLAKAAERK